MALDSILPTPAPQPPKAAARSQSSSSGSSSAANSLGSPSSSGASASSTAGSTAGSNGSGGGSDGSASSASRTAAKTAGKSGSGSSNRGTNSTRGSTASTQSKNASASSQSKQNAASTAQTQSTAGSGPGVQTAAGASSNSDGPSFIEALALSQAQAADSVSTVATAAPEEVTGGAKPSKAEKSADADASPSSLGFLAQSLAAVMAGVQQQPAAGQATAATADSSTDGASVDGSSMDGVTLASGSSIQNIVASLTKGTAAELKAVTAAADGDPKSSAAATGTGAADGSVSGPSAFQAQMSVGSHFQTTANTQTTNDKVSALVGTPAFNDELGGKITWMANQGVQSASLQLSPEHLGPIAVHISVQDGSASVAFNANHADARTALEQALPRLREMFATQGLTLTDASVSQQSPRGQSQKQAVAAIGAIGGASSEESTSSLPTVASNRLGLVDTYA